MPEADALQGGGERHAPGRLEAGAAAFAGLAFATGAFLVRRATPFPAGFFDGIAAVALGWGASLLVERRLGAALGILTRGLALAAGSILAAVDLVPPFDRAAIPLTAWALGASALQAATRARRASPAYAAAGILLLAMGLGVAWIAAAAWPEPLRLRTALAITALLGSLGLAARVALARRAPTLAPSPDGVLLAAALAASYLAYRPLVATRVANLPLYEWTLGVGAAALMLARLRRGAHESAVPEAWSGKARRHQQDAAPAYDPRMTPIAASIQRYLETGDGFEEYRTAMTRAALHAPPHFRKTLQGARPVQGRGRAAKAARRDRLATHEALMELIHGYPEPALRAHP